MKNFIRKKIASSISKEDVPEIFQWHKWLKAKPVESIAVKKPVSKINKAEKLNNWLEISAVLDPGEEIRVSGTAVSASVQGAVLREVMTVDKDFVLKRKKSNVVFFSFNRTVFYPVEKSRALFSPAEVTAYPLVQSSGIKTYRMDKKSSLPQISEIQFREVASAGSVTGNLLYYGKAEVSANMISCSYPEVSENMISPAYPGVSKNLLCFMPAVFDISLLRASEFNAGTVTHCQFEYLTSSKLFSQVSLVTLQLPQVDSLPLKPLPSTITKIAEKTNLSFSRISLYDISKFLPKADSLPYHEWKMAQMIDGRQIMDVENFAALWAPSQKGLNERERMIISGQLAAGKRHIVWINLSEQQKKDYFFELEKMNYKLSEAGAAQNPFLIQSLVYPYIHQLKQLCNFQGESDACPRVTELLEQLKRQQAMGQKTVVVSQYGKQGIQRLQRVLSKNHLSFVALLGTTSEADSLKVTKIFREDPDLNLLLMEVKTPRIKYIQRNVEVIIHYDSWWDMNYLRAIEKAVLGVENAEMDIYYFLTEETIEEKILKKLYDKGYFADPDIQKKGEMLDFQDWIEIFHANT